MKIKTIYYLIIAMLSYVTPIVLFGDISGYNPIFISITCIIMISITNYKVTQNIQWIISLCAFLHGIFISLFGVSILGITSKSPILTIVIPWTFIPALSSIILFNIYTSIYRNKKMEEYIKNFDDKKSLDRDMKINKIIGNIFSK